MQMNAAKFHELPTITKTDTIMRNARYLKIKLQVFLYMVLDAVYYYLQ